MAILLKNLYSVINGKRDAKDYQRAFTFIEFIKEYGYDNSTSSFLIDYKEYLTLWSNAKKDINSLSDKELIQQSLVDTLKTIILTYSSYEEQDFISNIDWNNELHKKAIIPFFAEKIKHICDFYKAKRTEAQFTINKNKFKGSKSSIEQIIYDKIVDFYLNNKNLIYAISDIQNNLLISIEEYVDIYSDYFDIPREAKCTDETRQELINANINKVNYEDYLQIAKVVSETLFNGEAYLEEIPLIAQIGLDFSAQCAGDMKQLRDELLNSVTINQVSLNDQILLRRRLYEKYLGCDLYYIYCNTPDNVYFDILAKAENPTGNLLNGPSADVAAVESSQLKLLSHLGLFFKPDKMGVLKVNADDFSWEVDRSKLKEETFYVFPDPNKYGDIGNNKDDSYPLVFEFKLNSYIKNISSGNAKHEPLAHIGATTWNTYFSKQDNDFNLNDNKDFTYSFTNYANAGILSNYQVDMFGNEYGLFKFYSKDASGKLIIPKKYPLPKLNIISHENDNEEGIDVINNNRNVLINCGYFNDPRYPLKGFEGIAFPHDEYIKVLDDYYWTGMTISGGGENDSVGKGEFKLPHWLLTHIDFGSIESENQAKYEDHIDIVPELSVVTQTIKVDDKDIYNNISNAFNSSITGTLNVTEKDISWNDFNRAGGLLLIKPQNKQYYQFKNYTAIKNYYIIRDNLIIHSLNENNTDTLDYGASKISFFKQEYKEDTLNFVENKTTINLSKDEMPNILYNETEDKFYITIITNKKGYCNLKIIVFDCETNTLETLINTAPEENAAPLENFRYITLHPSFNEYVFSYNNELDIYLLAYSLNDLNGNTYFYQHQFRLYDSERFYNTLKSTNAKLNDITYYTYNPTINTTGEAPNKYTVEQIYKQEKFFTEI